MKEMTSMNSKQYFNKNDLENIFGYGRDKMKRFLESGILPVVKINNDYLISKEQLDKWFKLNANRTIEI